MAAKNPQNTQKSPQATMIWNQGQLVVENPVSLKYAPFSEGGRPVPPLKGCIQAAACFGGMHVGKQASKKVAPLKQNITPPTTDDTPLFTHSLAPPICFTLTFIFQDECFKLHSLNPKKKNCFPKRKAINNKPFYWLFFLYKIYCTILFEVRRVCLIQAKNDIFLH